jgi:iron complex transport system ATP-binding protein
MSEGYGPTDPLLQLADATVVRHGRVALDRVSLEIASGEHSAVVGPNGSGKSTLIQLLTCQLYPLARADEPPPVRILGRSRWNVADLRARVGIVSPDYHRRFVGGSSLGRVSGEDAVVSSYFSSEVVFGHHRVTAEMRARSTAALERMGARHLATLPMHRMSTGEVRRVLIARAIVHDPAVLVLDEPTAGLDLVAREEFLHLVRRLAGEGTTIVLITHHVEEIIPEIRRVILLSEGRVAADGPTESVLTSERLSLVYGAPMTLRREGDRYTATLHRTPPPHAPRVVSATGLP